MFCDFNASDLEKKVSRALSERRFSHSLGVANTAALLSRFCLPECERELWVAGILHDITKELSRKEQLSILNTHNVKLSEAELESEQVLHSYTAPFIIESEYPSYATENVLSATRNHTVGDENMSIFDEIIFLADYIEEGRKNPSSIYLREYTLSQMSSGDINNNIFVLHNASLKSIDFTISHLIEEKRHIIVKTVLTRNALLSKILHI